MGIIVKGMEMPKSCAICEYGTLINNNNEYLCRRFSTGNVIHGLERPSWCPLVELPEKHGRLIDADDFLHKMEQAMDDTYKKSENLYEKIMSLQIKIIISEVIKGCKAVIESEE